MKNEKDRFGGHQHRAGLTCFAAVLLGFFMGLAAVTCAIAAPVEPGIKEVTGGTALAGSNYYVSPTGRDSNTGLSRSKAWRTIQHAVDTIPPGSTIVVLAGTYAGARIERSGAVTGPMILRAETGAEVLINKAGPKNRHGSLIEIETWEGDGVVSYWVVEGFEMTGAGFSGVDVRGSDVGFNHHITVRNNQVRNSGRTGIFMAFTNDSLIEGNESHDNGEHGIYYNNSGDRTVIRGNRIHHNANCGLHMNGDISMGGDGVISECLIEANVIYENGAAGSGINMDGVTHSVVRNNLLYAAHASGISLYRIDAGECSHDNQVLNNTILIASNGRWAVNIPDPGCTGNRIFNNILYNYHSWHGCIIINESNLEGFASDYNAVMNRFSTDPDDETVITFAQWKALGYDTHSFLATPDQLFADPDTGDFHLNPSGPAIDTGSALVDVAADLEGVPRPKGAGFDVGAYEYYEPIVSITAADPYAYEKGPDQGTFTVGRTGSWSSPLVVKYHVGGTAEKGSDYKRLSGKVTLKAGSSTARIRVTPVDNAKEEGPETVKITLKDNENYEVGLPKSAVVVIKDND